VILLVVAVEFGISLWSMGRNPAESLKRAAEAGFRYVEVWTEPYEEFEGRVDELVRAIDKYGVKAYSLHAPFFGLDISAIDEDARRRSLEKVLRSLEIAERLGCSCFIIHPSSKSYHRKEDYEKAKLMLLKSVEEIEKASSGHGVRVSLENMLAPREGFRVGTSVAELREIAEKVSLGEVGICLDTGHTNYNGLEVAEEVREAGDLLAALHINDNDGSGDQHLVPGEGTIDWHSFLEALKDTGYDGLLMFEIYGGDHPEERLNKSYQTALKMLKELSSL